MVVSSVSKQKLSNPILETKFLATKFLVTYQNGKGCFNSCRKLSFQTCKPQPCHVIATVHPALCQLMYSFNVGCTQCSYCCCSSNTASPSNSTQNVSPLNCTMARELLLFDKFTSFIDHVTSGVAVELSPCESGRGAWLDMLAVHKLLKTIDKE